MRTAACVGRCCFSLYHSDTLWERVEVVPLTLFADIDGVVRYDDGIQFVARILPIDDSLYLVVVGSAILGRLLLLLYQRPAIIPRLAIPYDRYFYRIRTANVERELDFLCWVLCFGALLVCVDVRRNVVLPRRIVNVSSLRRTIFLRYAVSEIPIHFVDNVRTYLRIETEL